MCEPLKDCLLGLREYVEEMRREGEPYGESLDYALEYAQAHDFPNYALASSIVMNVYYWR